MQSDGISREIVLNVFFLTVIYLYDAAAHCTTSRAIMTKTSVDGRILEEI